MKKSRRPPKEGDIFVLQPKTNVFYFGKVIQTDIECIDSFINGMSLIYIYDCKSDIKQVPSGWEKSELLIPPMVVNNQSWIKGYFETICNIKVTECEKKIDFGFWDLVTGKYVDVYRNEISKKPSYCSVFGLASYGIVGKEVQKAILKT